MKRKIRPDITKKRAEEDARPGTPPVIKRKRQHKSGWDPDRSDISGLYRKDLTDARCHNVDRRYDERENYVLTVQSRLPMQR